MEGCELMRRSRILKGNGVPGSALGLGQEWGGGIDGAWYWHYSRDPGKDPGLGKERSVQSGRTQSIGRDGKLEGG